jgi:hypothetical protein
MENINKENLDLNKEAELTVGLESNRNLKNIDVNTEASIIETSGVKKAVGNLEPILEGILTKSDLTTKSAKEVSTKTDEESKILSKIVENTNKKEVQKVEIESKNNDLAGKFFSLLKGQKGDTPVKGKDYFTKEEINEIKEGIRSNLKKEVSPTKGKDYFTQKEVDNIVNEVFSKIKVPKDGKTPIRGVDYFTDADIRNFIYDIIIRLPKVKDDKDVDENAIFERLVKKIPKIKELKPDTAEDIADKLNTLSKKLDWKVLKNIPDMPKGGGSGLNKVFVDETTILGSGLADNPLRVIGGGSGGGDFFKDGSVSMTGDFNTNGNNIVNLGDITFRTGAQGGTVRTGKSAADKYILQAYDVNGSAYVDLVRADAGVVPTYTIYLGSLIFADTTDNTKTILVDTSGGTTNKKTTLLFAPTLDRTLTFPDATGTVALTSDITGTNSGTNTGDQDLSGLVPYTGATTDLDMGGNDIITQGNININGGVLTVGVGLTMDTLGLLGSDSTVDGTDGYTINTRAGNGKPTTGTGNGGSVEFTAGNGGGVSGHGGSVYFTGGNATGTNKSGGSITFVTGNETGSGDMGEINLRQAGSESQFGFLYDSEFVMDGRFKITQYGSNLAIFDTSELATDDRTYTFPDKDGTFAMLDDVVGGVTEHGLLDGLADDGHTQYALLTGRAGGQTFTGGTESGNNLTLITTSHATKGKVILGTLSAYDQVNDRLGIGTTSPDTTAHIVGNIKAKSAFNFTLTASASSVAVTFPVAFDVAPVVVCTPPYQTSFWVTSITTTGFTLNVGTTNGYNTTWNGIAIGIA